MITFTVDLENHRQDQIVRYEKPVRKILELLESNSVKATIFVEGQLIDTASALIKEISSLGHEIGYHWEKTEYLFDVDPITFLTVSKQRRQQIEELTGRACIGFRAPVFSVPTYPKTSLSWFSSALVESGFKYSSSFILTGKKLTKLKQYGNGCFRWPSGLLEIPVPTLLNNVNLPFMGGIYFRYLPRWIIEYRIQAIHLSRPSAELWAYFHPYDVDNQEGYVRFPNRGILASILLSYARDNALEDIRWFLKNFVFHKSFSDRLDEISSKPLPFWHSLSM